MDYCPTDDPQNPYTKTYVKCAIVDCTYKSVQITETGAADGTVTYVIMDGETILPPSTPFMECKEITPVVSACPPAVVEPPPPPVDAPAITCDGETTVLAADLLSQAVHTAPGIPLLVKLCPEASKFDREFVIMCAPDGTKVITQNVTPDDAPLGAAPVIESWTLAGAPYAGDITLLTDCGSEKIDVSAALWFCMGGQPISRTDFWDIFSTPRTLLGSIWQDLGGVAIPAPATGTYVVGDCSCVNFTAAQRGIQPTW